MSQWVLVVIRLCSMSRFSIYISYLYEPSSTSWGTVCNIDKKVSSISAFQKLAPNTVQYSECSTYP